MLINNPLLYTKIY